jgi:hypothetical protein
MLSDLFGERQERKSVAVAQDVRAVVAAKQQLSKARELQAA